MKKIQLWIIIALILIIVGFGIYYKSRVSENAGLGPSTSTTPPSCKCPVHVGYRGTPNDQTGSYSEVSEIINDTCSSSSPDSCSSNECYYTIQGYNIDEQPIAGTSFTWASYCKYS